MELMKGFKALRADAIADLVPGPFKQREIR